MICATIVPQVYGGAEQQTVWTEQKLKEYGHDVEVMNIPFCSDYRLFMKQMLGLRLYHLEDYAERIICIRMPSYLIQHEQKYLWFLHHYREVYDLWDTEFSVPHTPEGKAIREFVMRADQVAFAEAKAIYTNSKGVSKRLQDYSGVDSTPLYTPLLHPEHYHCDEYGDFIYYASRITGPKRQVLAIEAMKYTTSGVKLLLNGSVEYPSYEEELKDMIRENGLEGKVILDARFVPDEEKIENLAKCLAFAYVPLDEDGIGYATLEAMYSRKAVVSCADSGGPLELVQDGKTGFVVPNTPQEIAKAFDQLYEDRKLAERLGQGGVDRIDELGVSWDNVIRRFTT